MSDDAEALRARLRSQIAAIEGNTASTSSASEQPDVSSVSENTGVQESLCDNDEAERAFRKIERLACVREQASAELSRRLIREGFSEAATEAALSRALACGLIDDLRFADVLVRSRLAQGRGRQGIAAELAGLNITVDEVGAFEESEEGSSHEVDRALAVLERKPPRAKNRRDAAYRRLIQKGFGSDVASTAARLWVEAQSSRE